MKRDNKEKLTGSLGVEFGSGLRRTSNYTRTQEEVRRRGITEHALNQTPPVGLNLQIISHMPIIEVLKQKFAEKPLHVTMLGLAIADGVEDFRRFVNSTLGSPIKRINVVEIDGEMIQEVVNLNQNDVSAIHNDARHTGLGNASQDIVIRDHLGNCCPPEIDRAIDAETQRILKPGGIAVVNITTSEDLLQSARRNRISLNQASSAFPTEILEGLRNDVYDLHQLKVAFGDNWERLRSQLIEIEPGSFVIFGEDKQGHAEWFRGMEDHIRLWQRDGFKVLGIQTRKGKDSHNPPLECLRHNVILQKS